MVENEPASLSNGGKRAEWWKTSQPHCHFDLPCARRHAQLWAELESLGRRIGAHDMLIAATGLRHGLEIATLNEGEFERIEGLKLAKARPYLKKC